MVSRTLPGEDRQRDLRLTLLQKAKPKDRSTGRGNYQAAAGKSKAALKQREQSNEKS